MDVRLEKNYSYHICKIFILLVFNGECMEGNVMSFRILSSFECFYVIFKRKLSWEN